MATRSPSPAFVGRTAELDAFAEAVAEARSALPAVLLISGDAGIGKSSLLVEAARRARVPLYLGRCGHVGGELIPLAPLADLLRQIRRSGPDGLAVPDLLSVWDSVPARAAAAPGRDGRGGLFIRVLELLGSLADDGPAIVGIEDLHWADEATWDLFEFLARNLVDERVVLVGTHRADDAHVKASHRRRLAELGRLPGSGRLHLTGLGDDEVRARVSALIGGSPSRELLEGVLLRGQGNPFFTEELVAAHLAGQDIPLVLSDLISADVSDLDPAARWVLAALSTVGHETTHQILMSIADLPPEAEEPAVQAVGVP